jgi:hypothetical protein
MLRSENIVSQNILSFIKKFFKKINKMTFKFLGPYAQREV